jgi:2,5-dihydroxypyridine 5,6-dioxygenase
MYQTAIDPAIVAEITPVFRQELQACAIDAGDAICLFTDARSNPFYVAAFFSAAKELDATCFQIKVPYMVESTRLNPRAHAEDAVSDRGPLQAMLAADLVIDLATFGWLYTHVHNQVLASGTRTLMVRQPENVLRRLLPDADVKRRTVEGRALLTAASSVRITHDNGTDLRFDVRGRSGIAQYGASDVPGRWDHWPSGQCAIAPIESSAEGVLVLNPGDVVLRIEQYFQHPVTLTFEGGHLVDIAGDHGHAVMLRDQFAQWKDPRAYIPAHIGWGCDHRCNWMQLAYRSEPWPSGTMDVESAYGNILFGIGSNHFSGLGGENDTSAHIDFCMRGYDLFVDDAKVLQQGTIVPEALR